MELIMKFVDIFLHLDKYLGDVIQQYGSWTYTILFLILFIETGLVIVPFLPGDSLIFAAGAFAGLGHLNIFLLIGLLITAAITGDMLNYHIGKFIGSKAFNLKNSRIFKQEYLEKTEAFYEKHGGKAIILARFIPIIRTFVPFVAGVGRMNYSKFFIYNVIGGVLWVSLFSIVGYFFGTLPIVRDNFTAVIMGIVGISALPIVYEYVKNNLEKRKKAVR